MAGSGAPSGAVAGGSDLRVAIVGTRWHETISDALVEGAKRAVADAGAPLPTVVLVPGTFELPVAAQALAEGHDAVVALGVVIRGETPHFDYVCSAATDGLTRVALDSGVPVGFGVLTCDTDEQAHDRCGLPGSKEDKGREAAEAAMATAVLLREIRSQS